MPDRHQPGALGGGVFTRLLFNTMVLSPAAPPTPGSALGYVPFEPPSCAPLPYDEFEPPSATPLGADALPTPQGEDGIFLCAADVKALQQWAEDREQLCERLLAAEHKAAAREEELEELRTRLAQMDSRGAAVHATEVAPAALSPARPRLKVPLRPMRHSAAEANALATLRRVESLSKREAENAKLLEEFRAVRSARDAAAAAVATAGAGKAVADGVAVS